MQKKYLYVCKMLLIALMAVLLQGVFHEALHASSHEFLHGFLPESLHASLHASLHVSLQHSSSHASLQHSSLKVIEHCSNGNACGHSLGHKQILAAESIADSDAEQCNEKDDNCHDGHKACSSLSCVNGCVFLIAQSFTDDNYLIYEFLSHQALSFNLLNVPGAFFRPPIAFAV